MKFFCLSGCCDRFLVWDSNQPNSILPNIMKTMLFLFATLLALPLAAFGQITVKPVVFSGPLATSSGVMPGDFAGLDDLDTYTPAQAAGVQRIFYGIEIIFPSEVSLNLSEISWVLMRSSTTPWKTGNVAIWSAPTATSSPYMVAYNSAGMQVSINNATATGTTVSGVKRFVLGNHKWTLGPNAPAQQPMLGNVLDRYCMGYRIVGTAGGSPFAIIPPNSTRPSGVAEDRLFGGYATVGVVTPMTKGEWLAQLKFGDPVTVNGVMRITADDPSGVVKYPSGYYLMGLSWTTDLHDWFFWDSPNAPYQQSNLAFTNGINFYITPASSRRLFFGGSVDSVITHTEISWWPAGSPNS